MNVAFLCDLNDAQLLQCTLVLNCVYSDVIMRFTGGNNNSAVKDVNSCHISNAVHNKDKLNFTTDELPKLVDIIIQNFSINSTCLSDNTISSRLMTLNFLC
jgi:hypothetical protein